MRTGIRFGLRAISVATIGLAAWLVTVILSGRAARGQDLVALWSIVSVGCVALAGMTFVATRASEPDRASPIASVALAVLGLAALGFGLVMLDSEMARTAGEGYLLGIGVILAVHGLLAATWVALRTREPAG